MAYFHNYTYRHLLRSPGDYQEFKNLKTAPSSKWWDTKYQEIRTAFETAGFPLNGFSIEHTKIIDKILSFKGKLIKIYH